MDIQGQNIYKTKLGFEKLFTLRSVTKGR